MPRKPLEILGDNSLADSAIGFLQGKNVSPVSFRDFVKFWDAYVIYDSFYVEELPQRDVHKSQADFLESHENVRHFLKDLKYTDDERIERWEYAESSLTKQNFANFLSKEGLPKSLSTLKCLAWERRDEDSALNYLNARYSYSNEEVKRKVLRAVKKAILKKTTITRKERVEVVITAPDTFLHECLFADKTGDRGEIHHPKRSTGRPDRAIREQFGPVREPAASNSAYRHPHSRRSYCSNRRDDRDRKKSLRASPLRAIPSTWP